jgi:hypothetical protein
LRTVVLDLADGLVRPDLPDLNPACDLFVNANRLDDFPLDRKENCFWPRQIFSHQRIQDAGSDTALHDQLAKSSFGL